jgi:hypothetical protein
MQKYRQRGTVERQPGSGRHRISTIEEDEALVNTVRLNPFTTAVNAVAVTNFPGCVRTARKRIRSSGLKNYVAAKKLRLTPHHKEASVGWALQHILYDSDFWNRMIFSDEKVFQSFSNGRLRVYRPRNSRFEDPYIQETDKSGHFSVNIWAWISAGSPGVMLHVVERLTSDVYIRILEDVMIPSVTRIIPNNFIFQQENCSVHTARRVRAWIENHNINVLDWPSRSPDLNPIENMWGLLIQNLQQQRLVFRNREELLTAINNTWQALPQGYHRDLSLSMPKRIAKVIEWRYDKTLKLIVKIVD